MEEFIVYDTDKAEYIASIDVTWGDTEYTSDPKQARIFRGPKWREVWDDKRYRLDRVPTDEDCPKDIES